MKHGHSLAVGLLALALAACGGDGGGGGSNSSPVGISGQPRVEAVLTNPAGDPTFPYQDPLTIQTGDAVTFQLVTYSGSAENPTRNVLPVTRWRTTDENESFGAISPSGTFQAKTLDTAGQDYIVTAEYNGRDYSTYYRVNPTQVRLRGRILNEETNAPVYNATIEFYGPRNPNDPESADVLVGRVRTAVDGTFRASIPRYATSFTISGTNVPAGFYRSFTFLGSRYDAGSTFCRALLPLAYENGERLLVDPLEFPEYPNDPSATDAPIYLTPTTLYESKPAADGCAVFE